MSARRWTFAEAVVLAAFVRLAVRVWPLPRVVSLLDRPGARRGRSVDVAACVGAADRAVAFVAHRTCLYRSLVAFGLLARRGAPVVFHLGADVRGGFGAHAWLSIDGRTLDADAAACRALWQHAARAAAAG